MSVKTYKKSDSVMLSENFASKEFDCKGKDCCCETLIDDNLIVILQAIRKHFKKAVVINSGFRCKKHNKAVGGVQKSLHLKGTAADIVVKGVSPLTVAQYAESLKVKGIGLYDWGCHIDTRKSKFYWRTAKEIPVSSFKADNSQNTLVKQWQTAAINDGFYLKSGADGIWGSECETVAKNAICKKRILYYKYPYLTKLVQSTVNTTPDGKFGSKTAQSVKNWQLKNNLTADGIVGYNTWKAMLKV